MHLLHSSSAGRFNEHINLVIGDTLGTLIVWPQPQELEGG